MKKREVLRSCIVWLAVSLHLATTCNAAEPKPLHLEWNANSETNLAGYKLYHGPQPGLHTNGLATVVQVGLTNRVAIPSMEPGSPKWFYVTALNSDGLESDPSEEIAFVIPHILRIPEAGRMVLSWSQIKANGNLNYQLESSEDLVTWSREGVVAPVLEDLPGGAQRAVASVEMQKAKEFFRIAIDIR